MHFRPKHQQKFIWNRVELYTEEIEERKFKFKRICCGNTTEVFSCRRYSSYSIFVYKSGVSPSSYLSQCLHIEHFPGCNPGLMWSGLLGSSVFLMTTSFNSILFWNHDNWTSVPTISDVELSLWPKRIPVQLMLLKSYYWTVYFHGIYSLNIYFIWLGF